MFVGWGERRPPSWEAYTKGQSGDILVKERGTLDVSVVSALLDDDFLTKLHRRYHSTYAGVIQAIEPPLRRGGPSVALVRLDTGGDYRLAIWDKELAAMVVVGRRVQKKQHSWDPMISEAAHSDTVQLGSGTDSQEEKDASP